MSIKVIKAVCWTESNLIGLIISLKYLNIAQEKPTLYLFLSKKITFNKIEIINIFKKINIRDIHIIKANNKNFNSFYLSIYPFLPNSL